VRYPPETQSPTTDELGGSKNPSDRSGRPRSCLDEVAHEIAATSRAS
jgi:hypothetical protein